MILNFLHSSYLSALILSSLLLLSCSTNNIEKSKSELQSKFQEMGVAIGDNNLEEFSSHYSKSPLHLPPGAPMNNSKEKIKNFLTGKLGLYVIDGEPEITFSDDATMAYVYGEYHIEKDTSNNIGFVQGRFITIWKKTEGQWKCEVDIWNSPDSKFEHL